MDIDAILTEITKVLITSESSFDKFDKIQKIVRIAPVHGDLKQEQQKTLDTLKLFCSDKAPVVKLYITQDTLKSAVASLMQIMDDHPEQYYMLLWRGAKLKFKQIIKHATKLLQREKFVFFIAVHGVRMQPNSWMKMFQTSPFALKLICTMHYACCEYVDGLFHEVLQLFHNHYGNMIHNVYNKPDHVVVL